LLGLLLAFSWHTVAAHGGGTPQLVNEPAGPYWISVWSAPEPVRVGALHLTVSVAEPGDGREAGAPILGAQVAVTATPAAGDAAVLSAQATNAQATNRLFYEADLEVPATGAWNVQIDVSSPRGEGQVAFAVDVVAGRATNWPLIGGAGLVAVALIFALRAVRRRGTEP
jgi:hypothetical protein